MRIDTLAVHAAHGPDATSHAVSAPLVLSTTFEREADGSYPKGFDYSRTDNPNRRALEAALAALEGGAAAIAYPSGSAACAAVFATLEPGDHILAGHDSYYGTLRQLAGHIARIGIGHALVDGCDLGSLARAFTPRTRLVWIESPSNPQLRVADIAALAGIAREHGARLAVDNTFATAVLQQPLALGADFVVHSTTKYVGGHSDVTGGAVIVREAGPALERLRGAQREAGAVPAPFDCWLLRRGLATLPLRIRAQSASAQRVAESLVGAPGVTAVHYPGLATHPAHALARRQMKGFGAMLSFQLAGGRARAFEVASNTRLFTRATSLGGIESLVEHRASIEGRYTTTPEDLLRLSIGLEHGDDLVEDLRQALAR
jgi:cystathionine gamma-synthase